MLLKSKSRTAPRSEAASAVARAAEPVRAAGGRRSSAPPSRRSWSLATRPVCSCAGTPWVAERVAEIRVRESSRIGCSVHACYTSCGRPRPSGVSSTAAGASRNHGARSTHRLVVRATCRCPPARHRAGWRGAGSSGRTRAPSTRTCSGRSSPRRLARAARPQLRGGALPPGGRAAHRSRWAGLAPGRGRLRAHADRDAARAGQSVSIARRGSSRSTRPSSTTRRRGRRDTFFEAAQDLAAMDGRGATAAVRRSDACASSGTTTARRRRLRRSRSPTRRAAGRRPGWTPRSWPTAGSP